MEINLRITKEFFEDNCFWCILLLTIYYRNRSIFFPHLKFINYGLKTLQITFLAEHPEEFANFANL